MERIKTIEFISPPSNELREFDSKEHLEKYFTKHSSEIENMTANRMNRMFRLLGYRITRRKGIIKLKPERDYENKMTDRIPKSDLLKEIEELRTKIKQQNDIINLILATLQQHNLLDT
jgi:viroplasmin and RNaseH domain-containing protein